MSAMTIGRLAKHTGVNIDTIRYYERNQLLPYVRGVKRRAEAHLEQVDQKIKELPRVRRGLTKLVAACPGHGDLEHCPIIAALSEENRS